MLVVDEIMNDQPNCTSCRVNYDRKQSFDEPDEQ